MLNRRGIPLFFVDKVKSWQKVQTKLTEGSTFIALHENKSTSLVAWVNNGRVVTFIAHGIPPISVIPKYNSLWKMGKGQGGELKKVPSNPIVYLYRENMQGVDRNDQYKADGAISGTLTVRKWYHTIIWGLMDMTIANCYILYKELISYNANNGTPWGDFVPKKNKFGSIQQFRMALAMELMGGRTFRRRAARPTQPTQPTPSARHRHARIGSVPSSTRVCVYPECFKRTYMCCNTCPNNPHICKSCWALKHNSAT